MAADKLMAAWRGVDHETLYFSTISNNSEDWEAPGAIPRAWSSTSPALSRWEWNGSARVYAIWKGAGRDVDVYLSWYDGKRWELPSSLRFVQTDTNPGLACRGGELFVA